MNEIKKIRNTNIMENYFKSEKEAESRVEKVDKKRTNHYNYFTGNNRDDMTNYDICLNTSVLSYDKCADIIIDYMKMRGII